MFAKLFHRASSSAGEGRTSREGKLRGEAVSEVADSTTIAGGESEAESSSVAVATDVPQIPVPEGKLTLEQLHIRAVGHEGVPAAASILAFEPIQRVLAVASLDGRIKLFGAPGVEVLLQSPLRAPCKYLEFLNHGGQLINITTQNDIEVWNMENQEVVYSQKWEHDITAISVLQGTTYMYLGDDNGTVSVLQYEESSQQVTTLPYCIPAHITLGGLVKPGSSYAPSVVGILPQVDALFSRLVIAYGNGLIVLWGLHETGVLAIRGGTEVQRKQLKDYAGSQDRPRTFTERVADSAINIGERFSSSTSPVKSASSEEEEEEKEICTLCWACQSGSTVAAGYVDGDIWLWRFPTSSKERLPGENSEPESPTLSGSPVRKIDLVPGKSMKMPVILLKWCASGKGGKGGNGHLFVYGGSDLGATQALTVLSLDGEASEKLQKLELPLHGPFADAAVLSRPGGNLSTPVAGILVLCSPGLLHIYDGAGIASRFSAPSEDSSSSASLQPVPWQLTVRDAVVAKLFLVSNGFYTAIQPPQLPIDGKGPLPTLPAGTKWPITGGIPSNLKPSSDNKIQRQSILLTGHNGGYVQVWDASAPSVRLLCTVDAQTEKDPSPVSAIFMCDQTGLLAVGDQGGEVRIFKLFGEAQEVKCKIISETTGGGTEVISNVSAGFQRVAIVRVHAAAINTIVISKGSARLAVGDDSGLISVLDLATLSLLFFGNWSGKATSIAHLNFAHSQVFNQENPMPSSGTDSTVEEPAASPASEPIVLYVANKDTTMAILDGSTGVCLDPGPRQLTNSSTMLCMELLDVSPGQTTSLVGEQSAQQVDSSAQTSEPDGNDSYLIRCSETSLQVISIPTAQKFGDTLREVTLEHPCCWASTFQGPSSDAMGIILLHQSGHLEIRSLPDLRILTETTLTQCLSMQLDLNLNFLKTLTCAANGHTILIHEERELVHLSLLAEENDLRLPDSRPRLFDKDLAAAAEAALKYSTTLQRKKSMPQGFLGVLKSAIEQGSAAHPASELPKLFSSRPFTVPAVQPSNLSIKTDSLGLDIDLEIDDILIDLDDMDVNSSPSSGEPSSSKLVLHRVKNSPKGKDVASEESTRMQLFGDDGKPRQRTAEEIKAAYGHPSKAADATNVAAMARDKLMERGEKLQSLNQRTEEMQAGAENFASLAEQLAKKYEKRKWWEF